MPSPASNGVWNDGVAVLNQIRQTARRGIQRMFTSDPVGYVVGKLKHLVCDPEPVFLAETAFQVKLPDLGILAEIGLSDYVRHACFNDFKSIVLQIGLYVVVGSGMEV